MKIRTTSRCCFCLSLRSGVIFLALLHCAAALVAFMFGPLTRLFAIGLMVISVVGIFAAMCQEAFALCVYMGCQGLMLLLSLVLMVYCVLLFAGVVPLRLTLAAKTDAATMDRFIEVLYIAAVLLPSLLSIYLVYTLYVSYSLYRVWLVGGTGTELLCAEDLPRAQAERAPLMNSPVAMA
ncbi:unnamed protein product [Vitrella brassicaformis CCMP3155]|uniref:Uncharacterized protein n=1 Tax=Vitrella brassicaformis (strain CCMP3155) TaxID=1169540 RepID=A0A0G4F7Y4_VITBC|nr:unnamed protein product [Vitrella brassicaformis CCMP3155]|mmetsp:Transcript_15928/g.37999  ORF Transcript_15928/g.37999 Transcript_15928/m.37999 type:complete len:180 (-) Transcript_15928:203-742(-)|eukprot:CEM08781.1 unnamed protein product [Vitrella brassicaformis CCMP3155]